MEKDRKNILFITSDQQHYLSMGYLNPEVKTPNLDKLVSRGMTFHRAYTVNPTCTPTRASWITGQYPSQHGAYTLGTKLMEDRPTVGDHFGRHGYETALVGKAHFQPVGSNEEFPSLESYPILHDLEFWRNFSDPFYGFTHVELTRNHTIEASAGQHYAIWMEEKGYENWRDYFLPVGANKQKSLPEPGTPWDIPVEIHYDTWTSERTCSLLDSYAKEEKPFFLWASFFDPHPPYIVPEPYASLYDPDKLTLPEMTPGELDDKPPYFALSQEENPDYSEHFPNPSKFIHGAVSHVKSRETRKKNLAAMYGMMTMMDEHIGRIIGKVDDLGLREETLICFTTDHGNFLGQHGLTQKAIHHYEDLIKVPLVVSLPGVIPEGKVSDSLQSTVDLAQTFCSFAGLPVPREMTGIDESPVWKGEAETLRNHVIVENQHEPPAVDIRTYVTDRYKITIHYNREYGEMYDLKTDPGELTNLWASPDHEALKSRLLLEFLYGEMAKPARPMPRISVA